MTASAAPAPRTAEGTGATTSASPTSASPTARHLWTRSRALIAAAVALLLFGAGFAVLRSGENHGYLDPRSADPQGTRAVARLLADRGVVSTVVTTTGAASSALSAGATLVVTTPDLLTARQGSALREAGTRARGRMVLLAPGPTATGSLVPGTKPFDTAGGRAVPADCVFPAARGAGSVLLGGIGYDTDVPGADACYPVDTLPTLLRLPTPGGGDTVVVGSADFLVNEHLGEYGDAALAMRLLGSQPRLVWYLPSLSDDSATTGDGGERGFFDLVPEGWSWALLQLFAAAALAALWRARRLGPVVEERLPVVVRAAEATEGRARLYRRGNARGHAAETLRSAARHRIASLVGVPASQAHDPAVLVPAVSARLADPRAEPHSLLYGPPPPDDASLLRLADALDALERSIRKER